MPQKDLQLSDSEWELMKILWDCAPASVNEISEKTKQTTQWHPKTVRTMLIRLDKKGIVNNQLQRGIQHYYPLYSRDECESEATESFIQKVFDGALTPMIAHFTAKQTLTAAEKAALLALLHNTESKDDSQ